MEEKSGDLKSPKELLELVLAAEIKMADRISEARKMADEEILKAQEKLNSLKSNIVEEAKSTREIQVKEGIESAITDADEKVKSAGSDAEDFLSTGQLFIQEAEEMVLAFLLEEKEPAE